nr:HU family DNA-binding protein [Micromonospora sp. HK10]
MRAEWLASSQLHIREEVVNKAELIEALAVRLGDRKTATAALDAVLAEVQAAVTKGDKVAITGFGAFEKRVRGARTARNPRTGEAVKVKKTSVPTFRPGAGFKEMVASGKVPKATAAAKKTTTAAAKTTGAKATGAKATAAKKTTAAGAAKKTAAAKSTTAKKTTATKKAAPAKKTAAAKSTTAKKTTAAKRAPAKKTAAAKSTTAKKTTAAKKAPAKKAPAKKAATRR